MAGKKKLGLRCSSTCVTKDHRTFGECLRSKNLQLNPNLADTGRSKAWDGELQSYRDARRQGVQPAGTTKAKVEEAMRISDATGQAYQGA
jgi:hypothetical protein